jgi:hypothetical protein
VEREKNEVGEPEGFVNGSCYDGEVLGREVSGGRHIGAAG